MIVLGSTVKDKITGFKGVVTGKVEYIAGCNQALVAPPMKKDGTVPDPQWIDEDRIETVRAKLVTLGDRKSDGPDRPAPVR